jgi:hypothetical protein
MRRKYGDFEYILAAEPQERGAWHVHAVCIFPGKPPFIVNYHLRSLWSKGYVTVKSLFGVKDIGRYFTAYLGDIDYDEALALADGDEEQLKGCETRDVEVTLDGGRKVNKKIVKGGRLHLYPPQFHLYRTSRGIKRPIIEHITAAEAEAKIANSVLITENTYQLSDGGGFQSTINKRLYKTEKKKPVCKKADGSL